MRIEATAKPIRALLRLVPELVGENTRTGVSPLYGGMR
jgi:hypothetical protein